MSTGQISVVLTVPFFMFDLSNVIPLPVFVVNTSGPPVTVLGGDTLGGIILGGGSDVGGPDPLGGSLANTGDTLQQILSVNVFSTPPTFPVATVVSVGLATSPVTNLLQSISGIAFAFTGGTMANFTVMTAGGGVITVSATYNGGQLVNVQHGMPQ